MNGRVIQGMIMMMDLMMRLAGQKTRVQGKITMVQAAIRRPVVEKENGVVRPEELENTKELEVKEEDQSK